MSNTASGSGSSAVVVGGSLAGLMTALTLSREGVSVTVLERSGSVRSRGGGLATPDGLVERVTGRGKQYGRQVPTSLPGGAHAWTTIYEALLAAAVQDPGVTLVHQARVAHVGDDGGAAWAATEDGRTFRADILVGADGHRSVVRRVIAPDHPEATYAGYLIWIGSIDEHDLPAGVRGDRRFDNTAYLGGGDEILFGVPLPGDNGSTRRGSRRIAWAWYDLTRNAFLRSNGNVRNNVVHHSVSADEIPEHLAEDLVAVIRARWPSPWRDAMIASVHARTLVGTPISEYVPERLVAGRLALVGDAAHVATPMTGRGFTEALNDAEALATAARNGLAGQNAEGALRAYEQKRLHPARSTVRSGQDFSRSFSTA